MLTRPFVVSGFIQSGQVSIPVGARCWGISVVSGSALVNGFLCLAGYSINVNLPDSKDILGAPIVVGMSGLGNATNVYWVQ